MEILKKMDSILPSYKIIFQSSRGGSTLNFYSNINQMDQVKSYSNATCKSRTLQHLEE